MRANLCNAAVKLSPLPCSDAVLLSLSGHVLRKGVRTTVVAQRLLVLACCSVNGGRMTYRRCPTRTEVERGPASTERPLSRVGFVICITGFLRVLSFPSP